MPTLEFSKGLTFLKTLDRPSHRCQKYGTSRRIEKGQYAELGCFRHYRYRGGNIFKILSYAPEMQLRCIMASMASTQINGSLSKFWPPPNKSKKIKFINPIMVKIKDIPIVPGTQIN